MVLEEPPKWVQRHIVLNKGYKPTMWFRVEKFEKHTMDPKELIMKVKTIRIPGRPVVEYIIDGTICTWRIVE